MKDFQLLLSLVPSLFTLKITYLDEVKNGKLFLSLTQLIAKKVKEVSIPLYSPKEGAILNFYSWEEEFEILNITIEDFR